MLNVFLLGIVEPNPKLQSHFREVFLREGFMIECASSGQQAIELFNRPADGAGRGFDLVITEHILGDDYTGFDIIKIAREKYPQTKTVLITSNDINNLLEIALEEDIGSIIARNRPLEIDELLLATRSLLTDDIFGLDKHINRSHPFREFRIVRSDQKEQVIDEVASEVSLMTTDEKNTKDVVGLVLDEMISNALYAAPRNNDGSYRFLKGTDIYLPAHEDIIVRWSGDDRYVGFSVTDPHGTLRKPDILKAITRQVKGEELDQTDGGGGFYLMRSFIDRLVVNIEQGKCTETIGLIHRPIKRDDAELKNKSLLIFQKNGGPKDGTNKN